MMTNAKSTAYCPGNEALTSMRLELMASRNSHQLTSISDERGDGKWHRHFPKVVPVRSYRSDDDEDEDKGDRTVWLFLFNFEETMKVDAAETPPAVAN